MFPLSIANLIGDFFYSRNRKERYNHLYYNAHCALPIGAPNHLVKLVTRPEEKKSAKSEMFNFIHAANSVCFAY